MSGVSSEIVTFNMLCLLAGIRQHVLFFLYKPFFGYFSSVELKWLANSNSVRIFRD